jgi:photosystem II stability/assembly factor-like uncharacterized protein
MGRMLRCCLVMSLLTASTFMARAQEWKALGPPGGDIVSIAVDPGAPDRVYAVDDSSSTLFRSADHGRDWQQVPVGYVASVAFGQNGDLYVAGYEQSYKSTDHGHSWQPLQGVGTLVAIAAAPSDANVVYAFDGAFAMLKSVDAGATWAQTQVPVDTPDIASLIVDPRAPEIVYAFDLLSGVFKSTDGAASWKLVGDGLPTDCALSPIRGCLLSLAIDSNAPDTLYVGTNGLGIYCSADGGQTWAALGGELGDRTVVAVASAVENRLYAAVADDPPAVGVLDHVGGALYRSDDGGESWTETSASISPVPPTAVAIAASAPRNVYLATYGAGVLTSRDAGVTWESSSGLIASCVNSAIALDATPKTLLAAVSDGYGPVGRLFISSNAGRTWSEPSGATRDQPIPPIDSLVADPSDPPTVYASRGDSTLLKSVDAGHTWAQYNTAPLQIGALAADPESPTTLYAACDCGVAKTTNGGQAWSATASGLPLITAVAVDPGGGTVYAATEGAAYASSDGGASWTSITPIPGQFLLQLLAAPTTPATLFAATSSQGVFVSNDGGRSWTPAPIGLSGPTAVAFSPTNAETVYAMVGGQLYRSDDTGQTWRTIGAPLAFVTAGLTVDPKDPNIIYSATCGRGLFELHQAPPAAASSGGSCAIAPPSGQPAPAALVALLALAWAAVCAMRARHRRGTKRPAMPTN